MGSIRAAFGRHLRVLREARGLTQEQLARLSGKHVTYIGGIERGERNPTLEVIACLAAALGLPASALLAFEKHPLEVELNAPAFDILNAIGAGFRAKVDTKGKLAELYFERILVALKKQGRIAGYTWNDRDGDPDFTVRANGRSFLIEVKNVRSDSRLQGYGWAKVELQKTRGGRDAMGRPTRGYPVDHFDILAVCLFNVTGKWEFRYRRTADLLTRVPEAPRVLQVMQKVPFTGEQAWTDDLSSILSNADSS